MKKIFKVFICVIASVVAIFISFIVIGNIYYENLIEDETKALVLKKNPQVNKIYSIHRRGLKSLIYELIVEIDGEKYRLWTQMGSGEIYELLPPPAE